MRLILPFLFLSLILGLSLHAQSDIQEEILPRGFAPGEERLMPDYIASLQNRSQACITMPPNSDVRSIAEWEELQAVVITWTSFTSILTEIVRHAKEEVEVIIICSNENVVKNQLGGAGIDWTTNVTFIEENFNSIWVRDYGPNSVYLDEVGDLAFVDWIYNRPRPADDTVPEAVADLLGVENYCTTVAPLDLVHTGGNYMSDGLGTAFSSELVFEENGPTNEWGTSNHDPETVLQIMEDYMGITTYPVMEALPYDVINHIDMHMKLLDEETLIVGEYPEGVADGPQIEANIQYVLSNFTTPYGDPYEVIRVPMPPDDGQYPDTWWADYRTYANSIILNNTILVPTYEEQYDTVGLRIWEEAMPGYNIVGIDCNDIIPSLGALHCITKEVGAFEPLWITTNKINEACIAETEIVTAQIKHQSGIATATVYYKTETTDWASLVMTNSSDDDWSVQLPVLEEGKISYYIEAEANSGKTMTRPMPGANGPFSFDNVDCAPVSADELLLAEPTLAEVFPNPAAAITCIPVEAGRAMEGRIEVTDILGRPYATIFTGQIPAGNSKYFLNAKNYPSGTYIISLKTDNGIQTQKLIIQ
jgi:agmatine/peptidylarginine deiminase